VTIITISRQIGSLGSQVAFQLAEALGYRLVWRELINAAARRAGFPEMALAEIDELGLLEITPSPKALRAYRQMVEQIVLELASEGNVVLLGRAGQAILAGRPDALHVRVIAPAEVRARRLAARTDTTLECATAQVEASDRYRAHYLRRFYKVRWDDPALYHLVLNTATIEAGQAVVLIQSAVSCLLPPVNQPGAAPEPPAELPPASAS
jgi:cytidylate kinase